MSTEFGGSWWGQRWIEALERLSTAWQNRLPRGRDYAKKGHVISLSVSPGKIAARVQGSRSKPYVTTIEVPPLRSSDWDLVIETLASEARFPAQLLIGIMPADIDDAFAEHNVNLFPARNSEMLGSCTCPDKARPCKHIAAVHYAFGQALDRDPFLLFHTRGADRERLLEGFNKAWFGDDWDPAEDELADGVVEGVAVQPLEADDFNRSGQEIESMSFAPLTPEPKLLILDRLGAPRCWNIPIQIEDLLGPVFEEATQLARKIAVERFGDSEVVADADGAPLAADASADGFTSLALQSLADEPEDDRPRPQATFVLPRSLNVVNERIAKVPPPPPEPKPATAVRVRKGVGVTRKRRKKVEVEAPVVQRKGGTNAGPIAPPADFVPRDEAASGPVMVRRGRGATTGPAIVRRRGSGGIQIEEAPQAPEPSALRAELTAEATSALAEGKASEALRAAVRLWGVDDSLDAFLLLMKSADEADRKEKTLQSEAARIVLQSRERSFELTTPAALLLLCSAEAKVVADQIFAQGKKAWRDGPAAPVLLYTLRVLAGGDLPDGSQLAVRWADIDAQTGTLGADVGSVGSWLAWASTERPPPPTLNERLQRVSVELATWALGSANAVGGPEVAASWAVAVAEVFELAKIEGGGMPFLAMLQSQLTRKKRVMAALEKAVTASPLLP